MADYWGVLFSPTTWKQFVEAGSDTYGLGERYWKPIQQIKIGDYLICYVTRRSGFIAALQVISPPYRDNSPIWPEELFPCRLRVKPVVLLTLRTVVPVKNFLDKLKLFESTFDIDNWGGKFRQSLRKYECIDGELILGELIKAQKNQVVS